MPAKAPVDMRLRGMSSKPSPVVRETLKENAHPQITQFLSPRSAKCQTHVWSASLGIAKNTRSALAQVACDTLDPSSSGPLSSQEYTTSQEQALEEDGKMSTTYRARKRYRQGKSPVWSVKSPVPKSVTVYVNGIRPNDPVFQCTTKKITV
eukprot:3556787-Rhodomonas_salina.1